MTRLFVTVMMVMAFFVPAVSVGLSPLPLCYGIAVFYVLFCQPNISSRQFAVFAVVTIYLSLVAAKNAIDSRGDVRDFLYISICFGQIAVFCMFKDFFDKGMGDILLKLALICALANLFLMVVQLFDVFGINENLRHIWTIPWELVRRDGLAAAHAEGVGYRPYGMMNGFDTATTIMYLVFRACWVRHRKLRFRFLSLVTIFIAQARMLAILFILFEIVASFFAKRERKAAIYILAGGCIVGAAFLYLAARFLPNFLVFEFVQQISSSGIESNYSYSNRLESLNLAINNLDKMLLFGGMHGSDFLNLSRPIDSEFLLRSMQFGVTGFLLMVLLNCYYFFRYRSLDVWFLPAVMLWGSLTFTVASNFQFTPFLLLYGFVCRQVYIENPGNRGARRSPRQIPKVGVLSPNDMQIKSSASG